MHFPISREGGVSGSCFTGKTLCTERTVGSKPLAWVLTLIPWGYGTSLSDLTSLGLSFPFYKMSIALSTF